MTQLNNKKNIHGADDNRHMDIFDTHIAGLCRHKNTALQYKTIFMSMAFAVLFFNSCDDEFGARKESTPVIESASLPATITFGTNITLTARLTDPSTTLTTLSYDIKENGRTITSGDIYVTGSSVDISQDIFVPLLNNQADNAQLTVLLTAKNVLKGVSTTDLTSVGKRPVFSRLYLITDNNDIITLNPKSSDANVFEAEDLSLENAFSYKIAEKLTDDKQIDYTGAVFGNVNGKIAMINEQGESAFIHALNSDFIQAFTYNIRTFGVSVSGGKAGAYDINLNAFAGDNINGESFSTLKLNLENDKEYRLLGSLSDARIVYNPDFFERTADSKVRFLGRTGEYTLYYNPVRKNVFVDLNNPSYPDYLLVCGSGIGYPTKVTNQEIDAVYNGHKIAHSNWGFDITQFILFRAIRLNVFQGTLYVDNGAGFKPFENNGWGNEKQAGGLTFTGEPIISGNNDWMSGGDVAGHYRFTIDLNVNTVKIEKITL